MKNYIRRKLSYKLLPLMVVFILQPYFSYADEVYISEKTDKSGISSNSGYSNIPKDLSRAVNAADEINRNNKSKKTNSKDFLNGASSQSSEASSSDSYASNSGVKGEVNPQTGQLGLSFDNIQVPGFVKDMNISVGISQCGSNQSPYMLPKAFF